MIIIIILIIAGLNINVTITTNNLTIVEGNAFNFTCGSTQVNAEYEVIINGKESGDNHQRLTATTKTNLSQSYSFNTNYTDNTHTIQCVVNTFKPDHSYKSPEVALNVLCKSYDYHMIFYYSLMNNYLRCPQVYSG